MFAERGLHNVYPKFINFTTGSRSGELRPPGLAETLVSDFADSDPLTVHDRKPEGTKDQTTFDACSSHLLESFTVDWISSEPTLIRHW